MVLREIVANRVEKSELNYGRQLVLSWWICTLLRVAYPWEHCITKVSNRGLLSYDKTFEKNLHFSFYKKIFRGIHNSKKRLRTSVRNEMFYALKMFLEDYWFSIWFTLNDLEDKKMEFQKALALLCGISYECCILKVKILGQEGCKLGPGFLGKWSNDYTKRKIHNIQFKMQLWLLFSVSQLSVFQFTII